MGKGTEPTSKKTKKPRLEAWECLEDGCQLFKNGCNGFNKEKQCKRLNADKYTVETCLQDLCWYDTCPRIFQDCYINFVGNPIIPKDKEKEK